MADPFPRLRRFLRELKRRNVYKVAATYAVVVFVGLQAVRLLVPTTTLPGWADELLVAFAILGFPIALVLAWAFEMTPEGMRRTSGADGEPRAGSAWPWAGLAAVVVLAGGIWYATAGEDAEPGGAAGASPDPTRPRAAADPGTDAGPREDDGFTPSHDRPFVAVLPLENLSPSEENRFFAAGIHEEILGQLASVSGLGVYARTTMQQYGRSDRTVSEIGRELGAEAVLEGSVRRAGGRVRITVQLIDPGSRDHLWSETYERTLSPDAIFDIQADVAERVAGSLETRLTGAEQTRIARAPTRDMEAYDAFLRGRSHLLDGWEAAGAIDWSRMGLQVDSAVIDLREAVTTDSAFAEAHGLLGYAYALRFGLARDDRWRDSARRSAGRAGRLGSDVAAVPLTRGVLYQFADSAQRAEEALRRALASDPRGSFASGHLSSLRRSEGDRTENLEWLLRAVRRDPRNMALVAQLAAQLYDLGLTDASLAWCRYGLEHEPDDARLLARRVWLLRDAGHYREALALTREMPDPRPGMEAYFHLKLDEPGRAAELLDRRREQWETRAGISRTLPGDPDLPTWLTVNRGYAHVQGGDGALGRSLLRQAADSLRAELQEEPGVVAMTQLAQARHALGGTAAARDDLRVATRELGLEVRWPLQSAVFDDVRQEPWFRDRVGEVEARQEDLRDEVRALGLDLYPPGEASGASSDGSQPDG